MRSPSVAEPTETRESCGVSVEQLDPSSGFPENVPHDRTLSSITRSRDHVIRGAFSHGCLQMHKVIAGTRPEAACRAAQTPNDSSSSRVQAGYLSSLANSLPREITRQFPATRASRWVDGKEDFNLILWSKRTVRCDRNMTNRPGLLRSSRAACRTVGHLSNSLNRNVDSTLRDGTIQTGRFWNVHIWAGWPFDPPWLLVTMLRVHSTLDQLRFNSHLVWEEWAHLLFGLRRKRSERCNPIYFNFLKDQYLSAFASKTINHALQTELGFESVFGEANPLQQKWRWMFLLLNLFVRTLASQCGAILSICNLG